MRLIDADRLTDWVNEQERIVTEKCIAGTGVYCILTRDVLTAIRSSLRAFGKYIEEQPIAYDVDKVVKQLHEKSFFISEKHDVRYQTDKPGISYFSTRGLEDAVNLYDATKIVRHGGLSAEPLPIKDFFRKE